MNNGIINISDSNKNVNVGDLFINGGIFNAYNITARNIYINGGEANFDLIILIGGENDRFLKINLGILNASAILGLNKDH